MKRNYMRIALITLIVLSLSAAVSACGRTNDGSVSNLILAVGFGGRGVSADTLENIRSAAEVTEDFIFSESLGKCKVTSSAVLSVAVDREPAYYLKGGDIGWTESDGRQHIDQFFREQTLIREALAKADIPKDFIADLDGDGKADGITFVLDLPLSGTTEKISWPHSGTFREWGDVSDGGFYIPDGYFADIDPADALVVPEINGAEACSYSILSVDSAAGVYCHEFSHILGLADYYPYDDLYRNDNIGKYELMGRTSDNNAVPQYSLAYLRQKLGWLDEGEEILVTASSGSYSLLPVTAGSVQAVKIIPPDFAEKGEFFFIEAREKAEGKYDSDVNASGLIIYSVVPENAYIGPSGLGVTDNGNMYGSPEVMLFSSGADNWYNYFDGGEKRDSRALTYRDGSPSGVSVLSVTKSGGGWSFDVSVSRPFEGEDKPFETGYIAGGRIPVLTWQTSQKSAVHIMAVRADGRSAAAHALGYLPSDKAVAKGRGNGFDVIFAATLDGLDGQYIPKGGEDYYLIAVKETGGKLYGRIVVPYGGGRGNFPEPSFADFAAVLFLPGKPAFIAGLALLALCVLAGIWSALRRGRRGKSTQKAADNT